MWRCERSEMRALLADYANHVVRVSGRYGEAEAQDEQLSRQSTFRGDKVGEIHVPQLGGVALLGSRSSDSEASVHEALPQPRTHSNLSGHKARGSPAVKMRAKGLSNGGLSQNGYGMAALDR